MVARFLVHVTDFVDRHAHQSSKFMVVVCVSMINVLYRFSYQGGEGEGEGCRVVLSAYLLDQKLDRSLRRRFLASMDNSPKVKMKPDGEMIAKLGDKMISFVDPES